MQYVLALCCLTALVFQQCESANIVSYIPLPFYGHQAVHNPLWIELAKRGHKITLIQSNVIINNNENITHIVLDETYDRVNKFKIFDMLGEGQSMIEVLFKAGEAIEELMDYQLMHPGVQELLRGEKTVDLVFTEYLLTLDFNMGKRLNASTIGIVSMDDTIISHLAMGNSTHPLMYANRDLGVSSDMTFKERVVSSLFWVGFCILMDFILVPIQKKMIKQHLGETVSQEKVARDVSLVFINANPLFYSVRPLGPKTVNIGGRLNILKPKPLPQEFQDYLDNAKNGAIYFSLGSSITSKQLNDKTREVILKTFARLPYQILWKFEEDLAGKSDNVKIVKWLPQQDILRHPNVKLFITQGGLQSMEEAIFSYVPMIALPFYGDQPNNANKMVAKGFGLTLDHNKLDEKSFEEAILEVLNNPKYRETTKKLADLVMDQPMTGLEKAVWWTEYVLRHGRTDHFRNPGIDMPWYQFLFVDVICFFLLIIGVFIYAVFKIFQLLKWLVKKVFRMVVKKKKTKTS